MTSQFKFINPSSTPVVTKLIDWDLCVLCQQSTNSKLVDPFKIKNKENCFDGYKSLQSTLYRLDAEGLLSSLPHKPNISILDDGSGIANTLLKNQAKYHKSCRNEYGETKVLRIRKRLSDVRNAMNEINPKKVCESSSVHLQRKENIESSEMHSHALQNLLAHMDSIRESNPDCSPTFKMTDLCKFYDKSLQEMGMEHKSHSSRLCERILKLNPNLIAHGRVGQIKLLTFRENTDEVLRTAAKQNSNCNADAIKFSKVATVIRKEILDLSEGNGWKDLMENHNETTPQLLKTLLKGIIVGPECPGKGDQEEFFDQAVRTISQLICFHTRKGRRRRRENSHYHHKHAEQPVPIYLAMKIYGSTRSRELLDTVYRLGLSISYDRLQDILDEGASTMCQR